MVYKFHYLPIWRSDLFFTSVGLAFVNISIAMYWFVLLYFRFRSLFVLIYMNLLVYLLGECLVLGPVNFPVVSDVMTYIG